MKKGFLVLLMLSVALNASSLDASIAQATSIKVLDLIFLGAKVVGAIVVILGLVELLVEKDSGGQQGKKVSGSMKLFGGVLLLLAASVIGWLVGGPDSANATNIINTRGTK
ncbi:hypothetical protein [Aliarcobacter cryaerophilus]|jgi:RsiW-degrading membrane proteinase PrsW (M82 family)|uniref:hypothetical protein n=1 Tax=Aliarcobacter cryaerophilus TaxID=28198 RepID=UPI0021B1D7F4|nr:hypothetical protein [Aliarcobacter cryaerophilus]MCT7469230.1 hypothetical protein [Aliarcobacter cryaerophilus]